VRVFFTRAEEIGFVGATEAMRAGTVPREARMVLLENSRSFDESPIGGGPIVRVGDRMSTFNPALTAGFATLADELAKGTTSNVEWGGNDGGDATGFRWQRKLRPGGACEATVYQAYGYEATCLCLPLGNYHNMARLSEVESGDEGAVASARCGREHIALADFHDLVRLLVASGTGLPDAPPLLDLIEKLHAERRFVLE
jgi:endoglucanase